MSTPGQINRHPRDGAPEIPPGVIEVAAALIFRDGRLLIAQRRPGDHLGGLWEFPGGKREEGESFEACLKREILEELAVEVEPRQLLLALTHAYPEKTVHLRFYSCALVDGEPQAVGCHALAWIGPTELALYPFPPADQQLLTQLRAQPELWTCSPLTPR